MASYYVTEKVVNAIGGMVKEAPDDEDKKASDIKKQGLWALALTVAASFVIREGAFFLCIIAVIGSAYGFFVSGADGNEEEGKLSYETVVFFDEKLYDQYLSTGTVSFAAKVAAFNATPFHTAILAVTTLIIGVAFWFSLPVLVWAVLPLSLAGALLVSAGNIKRLRPNIPRAVFIAAMCLFAYLFSYQFAALIPLAAYLRTEI